MVPFLQVTNQSNGHHWVAPLDILKDSWGHFHLFSWGPKPAVFTGSWTISIHDCGDLNSYFIPNNVFLTLTK